MSDLRLLLELIPPADGMLLTVYLLCALPILWADIRWMIIPDIVVLPAILLFLLLRLYLSVHGPIEIILPVLLILAAASLVYAAARGGIGPGDIKLVTMTAAAFGAVFTAAAAFIAILLSASWAIALLATGKARRDTRIPWAPFIIAGTILLQLLRYG